MIHIRIPATSANVGPGFDSIGIALELYNHIWVEQTEKTGVEIVMKKNHSIDFPNGENNLIYTTMVEFYKKIGKPMPGVKIIQDDNIPVTRGLGSSAACIIGGLMAANRLSGANLSDDELALVASAIEGHPDNTNPALYGNMVVGAIEGKDMKNVKLRLPENITFATMVPDFPVSTHKARAVLPETFSREDAVFNSSRAALLVASLITGKLDNLKMAIDDRIHQPYRKVLINDMDNIFAKAYELGAKGAYLSGAGSTLIAIIEDGSREEFNAKMSEYLNTLSDKWQLMLLKPDTKGAVILED